MNFEQRIFAFVLFGGLLTFAVGLVLQLTLHVHALIPGFVVLGLSRIVILVWQILRPEASIGPRHSTARLATSAALWAIIIVIVGRLEWLV